MSVRVVISGGTGFLASRLAASLRADGHSVALLTRRATAPDHVAWDPRVPKGDWTSAIDGADAVVNLAGEALDAGRWTVARKQALVESRVEATRAIVGAIASARRPPRVLLSASAVGVYGIDGQEPVTEEAAPGSDFLARLCVEWEAQAREATMTRVVLMRTGLVLDRHAGVLPSVVRPFHFLIGGPIGSGRQPWSWIHQLDWVRLVRFAMDQSDVEGPLNCTAPNPATNADFARTIGRVLHRPSLAPAPAFVLRILFGEMAEALILNGRQVLPAKAIASGFEFRFPQLEAALIDILG